MIFGGPFSHQSFYDFQVQGVMMVTFQQRPYDVEIIPNPLCCKMTEERGPSV